VILLGEQVLSKALAKANWSSHSLDYIITVSCTGVMIPSLDAYLINKMNLRQDIVRLPVTEMGCVAGISGLIYAKNFLEANPGKRAALITVEAPTATFQLDDFSRATMEMGPLAVCFHLMRKIMVLIYWISKCIIFIIRKILWDLSSLTTA